jgi:hypothetical protein
MSGATSAARVAPACALGGEERGKEKQPEFDPLAQLLHELNQPLTGLQCSLELATAGSRTAEQYLRAIREGLELVGRMRALVEALREVADMTISRESAVRTEAIRLDALVRDTVEDLRPVAESRMVRMDLTEDAFPHACMVRIGVTGAVFRLLESALSLAAVNSVVGIGLDAHPQCATINIHWMEAGGSSTRPPFSPPDLALLVARAAWQRAGGGWESETVQAKRSVTLRLPWATTENPLPIPASGDRL